MDIVTVFERFPTQQSCIEHLEVARWKGAPGAPTAPRPTPPPCSTATAAMSARHLFP